MGYNIRVEQQVYTRARSTLFKRGEGYGTLVKTAGLEAAFIRENVHPYCVYPSGGAGPAVYTLVHFACGRMLFGRAIYKDKDFTGQRATFFAHNYILPPNIVGAVLSDIAQLQEMSFLDEWEGGELEEHMAFGLLHMQAANSVSVYSDECDKLAHLVNCIVESVRYGKRTYVLLPEKIKSFWCLLAAIYHMLPEDIQHQLGFCTYAREPVNRKGLHLIFLDRSVSTKNCTRFTGDFVIDMEQDELLPCAIHDVRQGMTHNTSNVSAQTFFATSAFWHIRTPHHATTLFLQEIEWLDANLDKLTLHECASVPDKFLRQGKTSNNPELYVMLALLKTCASIVKKRTHLDLRYLFGSYNISEASRHRLVKIVEKFAASLESNIAAMI